MLFQKAAEKKPALTKSAEENLEKAQEVEKTLAGKKLRAEKRGSSSKEVGAARHKKKKVGPYDESILKTLRNACPDVEMALTKKVMIVMYNFYDNLTVLMHENIHCLLDDNDQENGDPKEIMAAILAEK